MFARNLRGVAACVLLTSTALSSAAFAQTASQPSVHKNVDANGVDMTDGSFNFALVEETIGSGPGAIALARSFGAGGQRDNLTVDFYRTTAGTTIRIALAFGNRREEFTGSSNATLFNAVQGGGATLTRVTASQYRYVAEDGSVTLYGVPPGLTDVSQSAFCGVRDEATCSLIALSTTEPGGAVTTYNWDAGEQCSVTIDSRGEPVDTCSQYWRQRGVSNSYGYSASFTFAQEANPVDAQPPAAWYQRTGATLSNGPVTRQVSYSTPSTGVTDITDHGQRTWRLTRNSDGQLTGVRRPGSATDNITVAYDPTSKVVSQVTADGVAASYARTVNGTVATMTRTDALNKQRVVTSDLTIGRPTSDRNELLDTTSFEYDTYGRLLKVIAPELNFVQYGYDDRGNVTSTSANPKPGSPVPPVTTSAAYPASCANVVTCNLPTTTTDARGQVTDYAYDATHGGAVSVTSPAPAANGVRPEVRYGYTLTHGEYQLTQMSMCQTQAGCTGTADEVRASLAYDASGNVSSVSRGAGDGSLTATQAMTYDGEGNLLTVDGPLGGSADIVRYRYDAARQVVGTVSADPDGGGALKHRAERMTYRGDGQRSRIERGTVNGQSDGDWSGMTALESIDLTYDGNARLVAQKLSGGATAYALTHTSYDVLGRPECTAVRMNAATFGSPATPACTPGTSGSDGPDRITRLMYDEVGQIVQQRVAVGTSEEAADQTRTYTKNGQLRTLKDAENNLTTYDYDDHHRLTKTRHPVATKGAIASSTSDYEELVYNAAGDIASRRLRDGTSITFGLDLLGRPILKDLPGSEPDVSYAYDNLGRLTSANQPGNSLTFTYDALSRNLTQTSPAGTVTSTWDVAGRRTRLTYPGSGLYVDNDYLVTGEPTAIRENGATSGIGILASFGYDDLGRRTSLARGNGTLTSYNHDPVSRLASLTSDLAGTAKDITASFTYNPAAQIRSSARSNDSYAWTGLANGTTTSTANGLNQLASLGSVTPTHDARGNLTSAGGATYAYNAENRLVSSGSASLTYDPLLRLGQINAGSATTGFGYDGLDLIAEYDGASSLQRRFVHGPGSDEPLVQYEGAGLTDRRWLHADERGSIIAISNASGENIATNKYDEYGKPDAANTGRFQYSGQTWLPELSLYYYKNRIYSPTLGRFLQTDPIGTEGGTNLYGYVGNDPTNFTDPLGLDECPLPKKENDICVTGVREKKDNEVTVAGPYSGGGGWFDRALEIGGTIARSLAPGVGVYDCLKESCSGPAFTAAVAFEVPILKPIKVLKTVDRLSRGCGCLEAGTLVATPKGLIAIERIEVGDLVLAVHEATGKIAPKPVTDLIRPDPKPLYRLSLTDAGGEAESFHATDDHPWKVEGKGWVETVDLKLGDRIDTGSGADMVVIALTLTTRVEGTYNLTVADWHTFMVGNDRAVVHNACDPRKVADILKQRKASIQNAPLPKGSPSWENIRSMTMDEIRQGARANQPGYKTILKLLTDNRFGR